MIRIGGAGRLEVEVFGLSGSERSCDGRSSQQEKGCEELHFGVFEVMVGDVRGRFVWRWEVKR